MIDRDAEHDAVEAMAVKFMVYAADQIAFADRGWVSGAEARRCRLRAEVWTDAATLLRGCMNAPAVAPPRGQHDT